MSDAPAVKTEDVVSVGSRISWGAIFAGGMLALALQFLFTLLGSAVGLTLGDNVEPGTLRVGAIVWALVTLCISLFVGGLVISQFTVGENKLEAVLYGIIMWALLLASMIGLGAVGIQSSFNNMVAMANLTQNASTQNWEAGARREGVTLQMLEDWRRTAAAAAQDPETQQRIKETTTRVTWYAFLGAWVSMMAAAGGALVGAGPTLRLVSLRVRPPAGAAMAAR